MADRKKDGVDILTDGKHEEASADGKTTAKGPTTGEKAELFGVLPDLSCEFGFEKGRMFVKFSRATKTWELTRRQAGFACKLMAAHMGELPVQRRGEADSEEVEVGAKCAVKKGKLVVTFDDSRSKWHLDKIQAKVAIARMRAELISLPLLSE